MARRLPGDARHHFRTTDHADEIALLKALALAKPRGLERLSYTLAADLLSSHDDTGISLDDWPAARQFVELLLGSPVLPNLI
jgi:hypothetical protein